ncbi:hypothetical protein C2G38_2175333 [Gigaspora rosea]|uniref:Uncharacterized protein n=1 Tax=Gigaspora rosea TaxID=44941 RepID=A0A397VHF5_9GLOM|nr:hypothetical protein C2G38_2175333 [Gigaspora rosea]
MFLGGLKSKIASWLNVADPRNLDEALVGAHKIEASGYYSERNGHEFEMAPFRNIPLRNQNQNSSQNLPPTSGTNQGNNPNNLPTPMSTHSRNVNLCDLDDTIYQPEEEDAFVLPLSRHQPYSTQKPRRNQKKSESQAEERLQTKPAIAPALVLPPVEVPPLPDYPHRSQKPFQYGLDKEEGLQVLISSKETLIVEPVPLLEMKTNILQTSSNERTTAARCYVRIKNNPIVAVLDSGAAISLMSK